MPDSWSDAKTMWAHVGGVIAAVVAISSLAINLGFEPMHTWSTVTFGGFLVILTIYMNATQDRRFEKRMEEHNSGLQEQLNTYTKTLGEIKDTLIETRLDTLRIQLAQYMNHQPGNHDTILKVAKVYFVDMGGDWVMTEQFIAWAKAEHVPIPKDIAAVIDEDK